MSKITFYRPAYPRDIFRRYKIFLNGEKISYIWMGKNIELDVPSGHYEITATIDWCSSPTLTIDVAPEENLSIVVIPSNKEISLLDITIHRKKYLSLLIGTPTLTMTLPAWRVFIIDLLMEML